MADAALDLHPPQSRRLVPVGAAQRVDVEVGPWSRRLTSTGPTVLVDVPEGAEVADIAARLDFGTVRVNSHLVLAGEVPWGGFKGSGYGRDLSSYALDDHSRTKHVMHNHGR
ncbi:aldehyde dehydrogenase family protein [Streptomyces sp. NPDC002586]